MLLTYGLSSSCRAADVEGNGSHHGHKTAVKQAHDAAKYQEGLNIIEIRTKRKESSRVHRNGTVLVYNAYTVLYAVQIFVAV